MRVLDRQEVEPAGGVGLGLQVTRADGVDEPGRVQVDVDYSRFKYAYGGDFAGRLRLVKMPACALETPQAEGCTEREYVPADNDTKTGTLTATVIAEPDAGEGTTTQLIATASASVYALATGSSSDQGDYRASTLSATGSWGVSTGSGAFTYDYPFQLPSPPMGSAPSLALTYNSQSVDGRTSASNNQASWVGMGWDLSVGFIERKYRNCTDDGLKTIGDLCWDSPNSTKEPSGAVYVINLNGVTSELIQDNNGTGAYHLKDDPGWRVQRLFGGHGAGRDGEYWVISTQDGKRYYFGWGRSERTTTATASVFTAPVVGNNAGEPCHDQFPEPCTQAWRWNLDRAVDANEVETMYFYDKEYNHYRSVANADKARSYVSAGYVKEIQYGWASQIPDAKVPAKVELTHVNRCIERMADNDPLRSEPKACPTFKEKPTSYPDVPIDLMCDGTAGDYDCAGKTYYPTFFSTDMLWDIKTYVSDQFGSGWDLVQQYQTKKGLPNPDGSVGKTLWLDYIQRKTYGNGTDLVLPVTNFNGTDLDNKVGSTELNFRRVNEIHNDLGATIKVTYGLANACTADDLPSQSSNTMDCYWQKWTPEGATESKSGWFKKFLVTKVEVDPTVTTNQDGAPVMTTSYTYEDGAGWRFTNDPLTPDEDESWSDWRGYQEVQVTTGSGTTKKTTKYWLYRGLSGDRTSKTDPSATKTVTVNDGDGNNYTDHDWLTGKPLSTSLRDDQDVSQERTYHTYWDHNTAQYDGLPDARFVRESKTVTNSKTSAGWREHVVENEYDPAEAASTTFGLPMRMDDWGETGVSDNRCTTYGRAYNTDDYDSTGAQRWTVLQDQVKHYSVGCTSAADSNQDAYASTLYDGATAVADNKPADGNPTEVRTYTGAGTYRTVNTGYDKAGRIIWAEDGKRNRTTTTYSPANTWPLDGITTTTPDPDGTASARMGLSTTSWPSRFWGAAYQVRDANGNITKTTLDAAGRPVEVWKPTETGTSPSMKFSYTIPTSTNGSGVPDAVDGYPHVTSSVLQSGSTYVTAHSYTDAVGRARETQNPLPDDVDPGTKLSVPYRQVAVTRYDSAGNVAGVSDVFRNQGKAGTGGPSSPKVADLPSYADVVVDWAGRATLAQLQANGVTQPHGKITTSYFGDYTKVTPAVGGATDTYTDVYGQTGKVVEYDTSTTYTTTYGYTGKGELASITDTRGNDTLYSYNWAGQRTAVDDPDMGKSSTVYDANGQVERVTSNAGKTVLTYGYDNLGRETSMSSGADQLAAWIWDEPGVPGGKGQITSTVGRDADGNAYTTKIAEFDKRGRPLKSTTTIPANVTGLAGSYTTTYGYDAADHITAIGYPAAGGLAAETVTASYDAYGYPEQLKSSLGNTVYIDDNAFDAYGRLIGRDYGPKTGGTGARAYRSYGYDDTAGTRWLRSISTTSTVNGITTESQKDTYSYDLAGKIIEIREQANGQTAQSQCFKYNPLGSLTNAYTRAAQGDCVTTASDFKGPSPYQTAYTYDRLGNLQSVTDTDSAGKATKRDYLYPGYDDAGTWTTPDTDQPHGVRKINHIADGATTSSDTFTYDADGRMTTRVEPAAGKNTDYTWTKLGQLATVKTTKSTGSELTRYTYDADGSVLVRTTPSETVAYLGATELRTTDGKAVTATRYYTSAGATVAMRTTGPDGGRLTYLMADPQASTQLNINSLTGAAERRRYTPFGDDRSGSLPAGTDQGFLGKPEDTSTGLSLLGARAYDPKLGRFLSGDPLNFPYRPQNLSAYSYSHNDPINFSDPTGLCDDPVGNGRCIPGRTGIDAVDPSVPTNLTPPASTNHTPANDWQAESNSAQDLDGDGLITVYPSVEVPADWAGADDFIAAFRKIQADWGNGWNGMMPGDPYSEMSIASAALEACMDSKCSDTLTIQMHADALIEAMEFQASIGKRFKVGGGGDSESCDSFLSEAEVLLADGTVKKLKDIEVGDEVLATDPEESETEGRAVLATIITSIDKEFVELTLGSGSAPLIATTHHPFWSPSEKAWLDAEQLKQGMTLRTSSGTEATIGSVRIFRKQQETRNLTVEGLHTYYVLAGATPVLVHNSSSCDVPSVEVLDGTWRRMGFTSRSEFGDVAWGGRSLADASKLKTPEQLARMREIGLTQEDAQHWRNFYMNIHNKSAAKFPNNPEKVNPSARSRADLFQYYIDNL